MKRCILSALAAVAVAVGLCSAGADAETCSLELKYRKSYADDAVGRMVQAQHIWRQIFSKGREHTDRDDDAFAKAVKKEPAKYHSDSPVRSVVKFGSDEFGFVLDSDGKSKNYNRLYFDLNHNGDLTDDKVVEAETPKGLGLVNSLVIFPRVDLTINVEGTKVKYAFIPVAYSYSFMNIVGKDKDGKEKREETRLVSIQFSAAAYREGRITLDGKPRRIILLDYNSNGRFDDLFHVSNLGPDSDQRIYPQYGDLLLVDFAGRSSRSIYDLEGQDDHHLAKRLDVAGRLYDVTVTPAGDRLTLAPSNVPFGTVTCSQEGFSGTLYGDKGLAKLDFTKSKQCEVPEGDWRLLSYTIQRNVQQQPPATKGKPAAAPSLLGALLDALAGENAPNESRTVYSTVSAYGSGRGPAIKVRNGDPAALAFGPPYKPVVKATGLGGDTVYLEMSLVGAGGEICTGLMVDGKRPPGPKFTITTPKGEVVDSGSFEYG